MKTQGTIAILLGGRSGEREVSFRSGHNVAAVFERQGIPFQLIDPLEDDLIEQLTSTEIDAVFIALHGRWGEDGTIQGLLDSLGLRYTGSHVLASALAMSKLMTKHVLQSVGIPTAGYVCFDPDIPLATMCKRAVQQLGLPLVIKPTSEGSSLGVFIVHETDDLPPLVRKVHHEYGDLLFEKYVKGKELTVGLLGNGTALRALPVLELVPKNEFYDYEAKYTKGLTEFILPAAISPQVTARVQEIAVQTHRALGCRGMSRVDIMLDEDEQPYVIEVNTIPGLTDLSDLPAQAAEAGISYDELILEILQSAYED